MTTPSGNSSGGIFFNVLRRPVIVCAINWHQIAGPDLGHIRV
jgi:hypothetical protein